MARKLTEKQANFVAHTARGVARTHAARLAGFSAPEVEAYRLMRLPHVVEALHQRREAALKGDLAHLVVDTMRDLLGPTTPAATRYNAARWVLENAVDAGHSYSNNMERDGCQPLVEMDAEELTKAVASGMQALRELADQLEGHHVVDGQALRIQPVEPSARCEGDAEADFLQ